MSSTPASPRVPRAPPAPFAPPPFIKAPPSPRDNKLLFLLFLLFVVALIVAGFIIWVCTFGARMLNMRRYERRLNEAKGWFQDRRRSLRAFEARLMEGPFPVPTDGKGRELLGVIPPPPKATTYWMPLEPTTVWQVTIRSSPPDTPKRVNSNAEWPDLKFWMRLECTSPPGATVQNFVGTGQMQTYGYYQAAKTAIGVPSLVAGRNVAPRTFTLKSTAVQFSTATGKGYAKFSAIPDEAPAEPVEGKGAAAAQKGELQSHPYAQLQPQQQPQPQEEEEDAKGRATEHDAGAGKLHADVVLYFLRAHPNDQASLYGTLFTCVGAWDTPFSTRLNKIVRSSYSHTTHLPLLAEFNGGFDAPPPPYLPPFSPYYEHYHPLREGYKEPFAVELPQEEPAEDAERQLYPDFVPNSKYLLPLPQPGPQKPPPRAIMPPPEYELEERQSGSSAGEEAPPPASGRTYMTWVGGGYGGGGGGGGGSPPRSPAHRHQQQATNAGGRSPERPRVAFAVDDLGGPRRIPKFPAADGDYV